MIGAFYGFRKALSPTELPDYRGVFTRRYYVSSQTKNASAWKQRRFENALIGSSSGRSLGCRYDLEDAEQELEEGKDHIVDVFKVVELV